MCHPVHTHMRAADFKEAVRNPDAASACVTPFGMMQTAVVGSPDLCIFLFAEGGREGKGGREGGMEGGRRRREEEMRHEERREENVWERRGEERN